MDSSSAVKLCQTFLKQVNGYMTSKKTNKIDKDVTAMIDSNFSFIDPNGTKLDKVSFIDWIFLSDSCSIFKNCYMIDYNSAKYLKSLNDSLDNKYFIVEVPLTANENFSSQMYKYYNIKNDNELKQRFMLYYELINNVDDKTFGISLIVTRLRQIRFMFCSFYGWIINDKMQGININKFDKKLTWYPSRLMNHIPGGGKNWYYNTKQKKEEVLKVLKNKTKLLDDICNIIIDYCNDILVYVIKELIHVFTSNYLLIEFTNNDIKHKYAKIISKKTDLGSASDEEESAESKSVVYTSDDGSASVVEHGNDDNGGVCGVDSDKSDNIKVFEGYINQIRSIVSDSMHMMTTEDGALNFKEFWFNIESIVAPSNDDKNDGENETRQRDYKLIDQFDNIVIVGNEEWIPETGGAYTYVTSICQVQENKVMFEYCQAVSPFAFTGEFDTTTANTVAEYNNSSVNVHELPI